MIQIPLFGGVAPRVPPRMLADGRAQTNHNLLLTASEYRPLGQDVDVAAATPGAATLYRMGRDANGALRMDDVTGWISEVREKSYVRGQINDDATERTVVSFNDGVDAPRTIDATGEDRLLGVPAPLKPQVTLNAVAQFTMQDAQTWVSAELLPALVPILRSYVADVRQQGGVAVAGPAAMYSMVPHSTDGRYAMALMPTTKAQQLGLDIYGQDAGAGNTGFPIYVYPLWGRISDKAALIAALQAMPSPKADGNAFTPTQAADLADRLEAALDPAGPSIKASRAKLDAAAKAFSELWADAAATGLKGAKPVKPVEPSVPEWTRPFWDGDLVQDPLWIAYRADLAAYDAALAAYNESSTSDDQLRADVIRQSGELQAQAKSASEAIEVVYAQLLEGMEPATQQALDDAGYLGGLDVDPDRIIESRFYIVTHVTDWGEESAPSPVTDMIEMDQNDSTTVTLPAVPVGRHIQKWRVYRSNSGSQTAAFQFVDEVLATTLVFNDHVKAAALGEPCPTLSWLEPPFRVDNASSALIKPPKGTDPYLKGLVGMPNGIVAGFIDNFVAFCHPYHPYAWPVEYQITAASPIVGLGVFGQSLFVGTMGEPYIISGSDSASMSAEKLPFAQPCVSRRSIVGVGSGVIYASPDGLCLASLQGVQVVTAGLFSRADWQALEPDKIIAAEHEGVYYFWTPHGCWALDVVAGKLGTVGLVPTAFHRDIVTDGLYAVVGDRVLRLFAGSPRAAEWQSPLMKLPKPSPLGWLQVDGDQTVLSPVKVRWYGDGALRHEVDVTGLKPVRLPPGRWLEHEVQVSGSARVTRVVLASGTPELQGVA